MTDAPELKRYNLWEDVGGEYMGMYEEKGGDYVLYEAAEAEIERLRLSLAEANADFGRELYRAEAAEAEIERLRSALTAAESWIVDGGHVDDDDARGGETGARLVYNEIRAALIDKEAEDD